MCKQIILLNTLPVLETRVLLNASNSTRIKENGFPTKFKIQKTIV